MPKTTSGIRFIRVGKEIINLDAIAYLAIDSKEGFASLVLTAPGFNAQIKIVKVPASQTAKLLKYLDPMIELSLE